MVGHGQRVVGERLTAHRSTPPNKNIALIIRQSRASVRRRADMHRKAFSPIMQWPKSFRRNIAATTTDAGGLFISVLTNPTMGGVAAKFASTRRYHLRRTQSTESGSPAPEAIKSHHRIELPEGFQTSEFLARNTEYIDRSYHRRSLRLKSPAAIDYWRKIARELLRLLSVGCRPVAVPVALSKNDVTTPASHADGTATRPQRNRE